MDLEDIEVLVVRSTEIDLFGETEALKAMKALPDILRELGIALRKVAEYGFNRAVIATDHGFLWIPDPSQGHAVKVPTGTWPYGKTRSLLGEGSAGEGVEVMDCSQLAIPIDQPKFAFARGLATFKKGVSFFHDGVSPHENIIPVLDIRLTTEPAKTAKSSKLEVTLTYRGKSEGTITTRRPAIEVSIPQPDLLSPQEIRFRLVAMDDKKKVVGEPTASQHVDPATRTVRIMPGQAFKVALKMDETFQGFFTVRAEDPETSQTLATINLSTDYHD